MTVRSRRAFFVAVILLGESFTQGQSPKTSGVLPIPIKLSLSGSTQRTSLRAAALFGPMWCGMDGNIYARVTDTAGDFLALPVTRLSPTNNAVFNFSSLPGVDPRSAASALIAAGDSAGRVYYVSRYSLDGRDQQFLVSFSSDGSFLTKVPLDQSLSVFQLVPLANDRFFMAGLKKPPSASTEERARSTFAGIFDADAKMVKDLTSHADDSAVEMIGDPPHAYNLPIQRGTSRLGHDGNIYVLKPSVPIRVEVFSPAGDKKTQLQLWTPFDGAAAIDLMTAPGEFLVKYYDPDTGKSNKDRPLLWVSYSALDGSPRSIYDVRDIKGQLVCLSDNVFTALTFTQDGYFAITKTEAR